MSDNSKTITLRLDTSSFDSSLAEALKKIPQQVTVGVKAQGAAGGAVVGSGTVVGGGVAGATPVAMGGQPITGAGGYTVEPGVIPNAPGGLGGQAKVRAELMGFAAAATAARTAAQELSKQLTEASRAQAAVVAEEAKTARAKKTQEFRVAAQQEVSDVRIAEAASKMAIRLQGQEATRAARKADEEERREYRKKEKEESAATRSQYSGRLVEFERARMLANGIPGLVDPLISGQMSGVARSASHALGMYSQWKALGERHEIRLSRYGKGVQGGDAEGGGGGAATAGAAIGGAAGGPIGAAVGSLIATAVGQSVLSIIAKSQDEAQSASSKMAGLQLQRARTRMMGGAGTGGTQADAVSMQAARMGIGPDEVVAADQQLAQMGGTASRFARKYIPNIISGGGSIQALGAVAQGMDVAGRVVKGDMDYRRPGYGRAFDVLEGTVNGFGGHAADQARMGFAQTMLEMSQRGVSRDAAQVAEFQQRMTGTIGLERGTAMTQMYGAYQNPNLGGVRQALKQYADARQLGEALKGAGSLEEVLRNDETMSLQRRMEVDKAGGKLALIGRGYSVAEAEEMRTGTFDSQKVSLGKANKNADPEMRAAAIGAETELAQMTIVEKNTARIAEAQAKLIEGMTKAGDILNSIAAELTRNWMPFGASR